MSIMKKHTSKQVALYFIAFNRAELRLGYTDYSITETELEKLLFYAQGISLCLTNKPLMKEKFQMTKTGPIIVPIHQQFHGFDMSKFMKTITDIQCDALVANMQNIKADNNAYNIIIDVYLKREKLAPLYQKWQHKSELLGYILNNQEISKSFTDFFNCNDIANTATDLKSPLVF